MKPIELAEFQSGVSWWRTETTWPADLHHADYRVLAEQNPNGKFDPVWWASAVKRLTSWKALRPFSGAEVGRRVALNAEELAEAWRTSCEPYGNSDIEQVTWENVRGFPDLVGRLKPTKTPSAVFTSKFCHFLLPRVFPVVDGVALPSGQGTYESYFNQVKATWEATDDDVRTRLKSELRRYLGSEVDSSFPVVTKIVEVALIGRNHQVPA
ncbi:hypothetical protein [Actinoplanes friuliensis]|uniref:Uncharacterized protein n=1 Tax=Actinoplanes friuliensis DSM 7358 TaxID=1246995 RepID=U5W249_9ACTN|nr:hypothetical protein [Actinoplanes friuliensis]AGZ42016.1 hypothetical protein AFR_18700 [Actinoplanes friuliensis DSM 7358]